jgi:hypothetical protein
MQNITARTTRGYGARLLESDCEEDGDWVWSGFMPYLCRQDVFAPSSFCPDPPGPGWSPQRRYTSPAPSRGRGAVTGQSGRSR